MKNMMTLAAAAALLFLPEMAIAADSGSGGSGAAPSANSGGSANAASTGQTGQGANGSGHCDTTKNAANKNVQDPQSKNGTECPPNN